jgi:hypothetical protein
VLDRTLFKNKFPDNGIINTRDVLSSRFKGSHLDIYR